jgi:hypothetical protein
VRKLIAINRINDMVSPPRLVSLSKTDGATVS